MAYKGAFATVAEFTFPDLQGIQEPYDRDGYVIVRKVLDADLVGEIDRHVDWMLARHPELRPEAIPTTLIAKDPFWVRFLSDPHLLDVAESLVGPDIALFAADYICKPPGIGRALHWHQDAHYWPLEPMDVITVWFAVTKSVRANGCVRFIPGSHQLGLQAHSSERDEDILLNPVDPTVVDEGLAVDIELEPGDISVHHPLILHGSEPNRSDSWRRGGSIQYMPATTRVTVEWQSLFLFRGDPVEGVNDYLPSPRYIEGEHMAFRGCEART